jgi:hypothetical protein
MAIAGFAISAGKAARPDVFRKFLLFTGDI